MKVELIDHMGSDLSVVNAARVSFSKTSELEDGKLPERDHKLIQYLAKHNHWTPFAHTSISIRVQAPIFVARQLGKHQVGLVWNEVSRRYVDSEPEFQFMVLRQRADNVKQGSRDEFPANLEYCEQLIGTIERLTVGVYKRLLSEGVCPEQARAVLPQSMMTEWVWTGSLNAFHRVCKLRLDPHTQRETQEIAKGIAKICAELFPVSWEALG